MVDKIELKEGDTVTTTSYHVNENRGGAKYDILSSTTEEVDNSNIIKLDNGLYAKFSATNGVMTIDQYGLNADGINNDSEIINKAIKNNIEIDLTMENYLLDSPIIINNISNKSFLGNGSNIIISSDFPENKAVFEIESTNNITIDGFNIVNADDNANEYNSIYKVINSSSLTLNDNEINNYNSSELFDFENVSSVIFTNNKINHDFTNESIIFNEVFEKVSNNEITINSNNNSRVILFNNVTEIKNNIIEVNTQINTVFNFDNLTIKEEVNLSSNTINYNYDEISNNVISNFIEISNTKLNNNIINITNNNVYGSKIGDSGYLLLYKSIDDNEQTINLSRNNIESYHKRYVIGSDIVNINVTPKENKTVTSLSTMKSDNSLESGNVVKTNGFYEGNSTGSSYYTIVDSTKLIVDGIEVVALDNGKYAIMYTTGLPVSVNQFGAYGDGINGDVDSLNAAFNSGYTDIYLETGSYVIDKLWKMSRISNINFDGKDNLMLFDNNMDIVSDRTQTGHEKYSEFAIRVEYSSYLNFTNVKIHNFASDHFLAQLGILRSGNITIENSEFYIAEEVESTNLDLWSDWENITVTNNRIINEGDVWQGGNIWIRDVQNQGAYNAIVTDNYFYKQTHDELLGIFQGEVVDVYIARNEFITEEGINSTDSIINIRLGSESNTKVSGIIFEENSVDTQATMGALWGDGATDTIIRNNVIKFRKTDDSYIGYVVDANSHSSSVVGTFAIYDNNELTVTADSEEHTLYIYSDIDNLTNDSVTINNEFSNLYNKIKNLEENDAYINAAADKIFNGITNASNNYIQINAKVKNIYNISTLSEPALYENNVVDYLYDQVVTPASDLIIVAFNNINLNGHSVTFNNNTLNHPNADMDSIFIYANLKDTTEQNIYFNQNDFAGYTDQRIYPAEYRDLYNIEIVE